MANSKSGIYNFRSPKQFGMANLKSGNYNLLSSETSWHRQFEVRQLQPPRSQVITIFSAMKELRIANAKSGDYNLLSSETTWNGQGRKLQPPQFRNNLARPIRCQVITTSPALK